MSRTRDVLELLARSRPARLDPPTHWAEDHAQAVSAIVGRETGAVVYARPPVRRTRVAVLASAGLTAAVVAVATVGVTVAGRHTSPAAVSGADTTPAPPAAHVDAGQLLLAAAERSTSVPSAGGRYLTLQSEVGSAMSAEAAGGRYAVMERSLNQYWLARSGAGNSWVMVQPLGARPATPADEVAWRRAGSPSVMRVTLPKPAELRIAPGKVHGNTVDRDRIFGLGDRSLSQADLDAMPTDPAALRRFLLSGFDGGGGDEPTDRNQWLLGVAAGVLTDLPVSKSVRAAAYRLIAELPGVRGLGAVRDVRGRRGEAVAFVQDSPVIGSFEVRLIIDPDTGQALGREMRAMRPRGRWSWIEPGALAIYQLVLVSQNTDDSPPKVDVVD